MDNSLSVIETKMIAFCQSLIDDCQVTSRFLDEHHSRLPVKSISIDSFAHKLFQMVGDSRSIMSAIKRGAYESTHKGGD